MSKTDEAEQCRLYGDLAWLWPLIIPPADYLAEADEVATLLRRFGRREMRRVLDLGCGGRHFDYGLKRHFGIVGVDLSEAVLALARELNPEVTYLRGDLRAPSPLRSLSLGYLASDRRRARLRRAGDYT